VKAIWSPCVSGCASVPAHAAWAAGGANALDVARAQPPAATMQAVLAAASVVASLLLVLASVAAGM
jgi:hypothetical protein